MGAREASLSPLDENSVKLHILQSVSMEEGLLFKKMGFVEVFNRVLEALEVRHILCNMGHQQGLRVVASWSWINTIHSATTESRTCVCNVC